MSNDTTNAGFEHMGYRYQPEYDDQGDCVKTIHEIIYIKTGKLAGYVQVSPYATPTVEQIARQIEFISECNCEQVAAGITPACYEVSLTKGEAETALCNAEYEAEKAVPKVRRGGKALVFKGRKIKVGTEVDVFWVGTKRNSFSGAWEERAGVTLPDGTKVFCSACNLDPLPTVQEIEAHGKAQKALEEARKAMAAFDPALV
jgi:hypothetical protein